jgi:tripartite-type tricarboxylate transporter receptor subunit TctC
LITTMPHIKAGKLKLLAVGGEKRLAAFPDVPAVAEALPGFRSETWMGLVAPPGTPSVVAERYSSALARVVAEPEVKRRLLDLQAEPVGNTPDQMAGVIRQDLERWSQVIRDARIRVE